ncbi:hypothetical protein Taro_001482 [Colocasia esculenta]|uniref:Uncharacterized protein n=1 Tax=Colocasia esculenta TaxID=4460 RepID=A0A843TB93_COLES|nr:hypothetical protein [Colocasia esculenta]
MQAPSKKSWRQKISQEEPVLSNENRFSILQEDDHDTEGDPVINPVINKVSESQEATGLLESEKADSVEGLHGDALIYEQQPIMDGNTNGVAIVLHAHDLQRGSPSTEACKDLDPTGSHFLVTEKEVPSSPVTAIGEDSASLADEQLYKAATIAQRENIYMPHIDDMENQNNKRREAMSEMIAPSDIDVESQTLEDVFISVMGKDRTGRVRCAGNGETLRTWYGSTYTGPSAYSE